MTIRGELRSALREAEISGTRIRKRFDREEFAKQFPKFSTNPLTAFTPSNFTLDITPMEKIEVGELRKLCLAKKDHPLAIKKALETQGFADHQVVYLLKEDLAILRERPRKPKPKPEE